MTVPDNIQKDYALEGEEYLAGLSLTLREIDFLINLLGNIAPHYKTFSDAVLKKLYTARHNIPKG
jgi:hypothetical protein